MNEQIFELIQSQNGRCGLVWAEEDKQEFAQLIVRECAKSANYWYQNHDKIHSDPMSYVLAHFGVEE